MNLARRQFLHYSALASLFACAMSKTHEMGSLGNWLLKQNDALISRVLNQPDQFEAQIIFSRIIRHSNGAIQLETKSHGVNAARWFAPASTVKLPMALLALERLNQLDLPRTTLLSIAANEKYAHPARAEESIESILQRILIASENEPFNALYDWLGADYINQRFRALGLGRSVIRARLDAQMVAQQHELPDVYLRNAEGQIVHHSHARTIEQALLQDFSGLVRGLGFFDSSGLIKGPHDFSHSNAIPLEELHQMMLALVEPSAVAPETQWRLREHDRQFVISTLSQFHAETNLLGVELNSNKFLAAGAQKLPTGISSTNKIGQAYGFLTDCAFFQKSNSQDRYLISASILVNKDQIFNDDQYEYDEIGLPYLRNLGLVLLDYPNRSRRDKKQN